MQNYDVHSNTIHSGVRNTVYVQVGPLPAGEGDNGRSNDHGSIKGGSGGVGGKQRAMHVRRRNLGGEA